MTEENKVEVTEVKNDCFCKSKGFRKFLIVALGSFVGVFCALSLFAALHRPPMMQPCQYAREFVPRHAVQCPCRYHQPDFDRQKDFRGDFHQDKKIGKNRPAPERIKTDIKG